MKFKKLTPNLIVRNVEASLNFYRTVLGFQPGFTVPDQPPYVFGSVTSDAVEIFFNDHKAVAEEYPALSVDETRRGSVGCACGCDCRRITPQATPTMNPMSYARRIRTSIMTSAQTIHSDLNMARSI